MSHFRPSQRTLVASTIILGLAAWLVLRAVETRRKDRKIELLESRFRAEANQDARWRDLHQDAMKTIQEQYVELMELRSMAGKSTGHESQEGKPSSP